MDLQAHVVAAGSLVDGQCPDCGAHRAVSDMLALTEAGPVIIGAMVSCTGCGDAWCCSFCPAVLPMDGATTHRHIADEHGSRMEAD